MESGRSLVSTAGGIYPVWAPDGRELFYLEGTRMMAVPVQTDPSFASHRAPEALFQADYFFGSPGRNYDIAPDGRFLMLSSQTTEDAPPLQINVVINWFEELKERVPVP